MLDEDVIEVADRWWAGDFDCPPDALRPATTHVQAHAGRMSDATGIWILVAGGAPLVSLPSAAMELLADRARGWSGEVVASPEALTELLRPLQVERIVGPAFIGYGTAATLDLAAAPGARALRPEDHAAVSKLRDACSAEEWDHGGSDAAATPTFGCFHESGDLLALAGYKTWGETIAHIAIVTARHARGQGCATNAVSAAARHALDAGLLPQYRTLAANASSIAVAQKLGFQQYGFSVYVRLGAD